MPQARDLRPSGQGWCSVLLVQSVDTRRLYPTRVTRGGPVKQGARTPVAPINPTAFACAYAVRTNMRLIRPTPFSERRYARYLAGLFALLVWVIVGTANPFTDARHRRRYGRLSLANFVTTVRNLIIIRASFFVRPYRPTPIRPSRDHARAGFKRRMTGMRVGRRQRTGAWMRRILRSKGNAVQRVLHLIRVLREIDVHARALVARCAPFTRLRPMIVTRPPQTRVESLASPVVDGDDTS